MVSTYLRLYLSVPPDCSMSVSAECCATWASCTDARMIVTVSCELHTACPQVRHWGLSNETTFGVCKVRSDMLRRVVM